VGFFCAEYEEKSKSEMRSIPSRAECSPKGPANCANKNRYTAQQHNAPNGDVQWRVW